MDKKRLLIYSIPLLLVASFIFVFAILSTSSLSPSINTEDSQEFHNVVCYQVTRADGSIEDLGCNENVVYTTGLDFVIDSVFNGTTSDIPFQNLTLCNATAGGNCDSPTAAATESFVPMSNTCGLYSVTATRTGNGAGSINLSNTWTSTCDSQTVNITKIQNSAGGNFSANSFTTTTLNTDDQLSVNYTATQA